MADWWIAQFCVDDLAPVVWDDAVFNNFVMPAGEKQLVWDLVERKVVKKAAVGRGMNIHMFGPPGVGKTYAINASKYTFSQLLRPLPLTSYQWTNAPVCRSTPYT